MPSSAENYHDGTKYDPVSIGQHPGMDWSAKPSLTKDYQGVPVFGADDLDLSLSKEDEESEDYPLDKARRALLMRLLYCTYGVTAMVDTGQGEMHSLRASPSAGGLYPAEIYVMIRDDMDLPAGVYNYHIENNALQQVRGFDDDDAIERHFNKLFDALPRGANDFQPNFAIFVTTIYERSSWRYQERGYRRCLLDSGHLIGNLLSATEVEGIQLLPLSGFKDEAVNAILGIDGGQEGALSVLLARVGDFGDDEMPSTSRALRSATYAATKDPAPDQLTAMMLKETNIDEAAFAMAASMNPKQSMQAGFNAELRFNPGYTSEAEISFDEQVLRAMLSRRSGRRYIGEAITFQQLMHTLNYGYARTASAFAPELLHSWLVVHNVQGLPQGVYAFDAEEHTLYLLEEGDFRNQLGHLALGQEIAVHCSAVLIHTVNLTNAVQRWGNRAYRTIHLDAGIIGQRLALAAQLQGFATCGIGGFFDDEVNRLLAVNHNHICAYLTTIGREA